MVTGWVVWGREWDETKGEDRANEAAVGNPGIGLVFRVGAGVCRRTGALVDFPLAPAAAFSRADLVSCGRRRVDRAGNADAPRLVCAVRAARAGHARSRLPHSTPRGDR